MRKASINMLSSADSVSGQGVGSAYFELVNLLQEDASDDFDVYINRGVTYDVLHAHTVNLMNFLKMKFTKGKTVAYVHFLPSTLDGSIKLPKLIFKVFKWYVIEFYKMADHLVVVNPIFIENMIRAGLSREKITYIPNFVSKKEFYRCDSETISNMRLKYGMSKDDFVVLGAGQVQVRKGVLDFIEVAKKMPDVKFIWAGGFSFGKITDGYEKFKNIMKNPPPNVKFLGIVPREDMNELYNIADVLFVPSYNELFPMTILEAMSTETPLLLRDLDLYENILFGKYLKAKDNNKFVEKLYLLKNNKKEHDQAVEVSRENSEFYSKEHVLKMWIEFYTSILNN